MEHEMELKIKYEDDATNEAGNQALLSIKSDHRELVAWSCAQ